MVIGNGMIAQALQQYVFDDSIVIFASGVSNSKETSSLEFEREVNLLNDIKDDGKKLVYFGTVSIYDDTISESKYIKHKLFMENLIKNKFKNFLIIRLPNVIGKSQNKNTFFNFIKNRIINNEKILIEKNAIRYFIDIDNLKLFFPTLILDNNNKCINFCFDNKIKVSQVIKIFEKFLNKKAKKTFVNKGCDYNVDNLCVLELLKNNNILIDNKYNQNIIKKYINNE